MKRISKVILTSTTLALLATSVTPSYAGDNVVGALLGATGGAIVGSNIGKGKGRIAAIAAGTLLGAGLGSSISGSSNVHDGGSVVTSSYSQEYYDNRNGYYGYHDRGHHRRYHGGYHHSGYEYAPYYNYSGYSYDTYTTYPNNYAVTQINTTYANPNVTPAYYQTPPTNAGYCREFTQTVSIGGKIKESYGTACMQPDGTWEMQK